MLAWKSMNAARQISRRFARTMGTRTRSATDYSITATMSVVPDPLKATSTSDYDSLVIGGRLGGYKYYDMDQTIAAALEMPIEANSER